MNQSGEREADFINIVVWRKQAENCANYLTKGQQAGVEGRLQIRTYDTPEGQRRWVTEVVADRVEFLERKKGDKDQGAAVENENTTDEMNLDDLPF